MVPGLEYHSEIEHVCNRDMRLCSKCSYLIRDLQAISEVPGVE